MSLAAPTVLAVNSGSSSLKFAAFKRTAALERTAGGRIEGIDPEGAAGSTLAQALLGRIAEQLPLAGITCVGHRLVQGGSAYGPQVISPDLLARLETLQPLDPEHLPMELRLIRAIERALPGIPQVACFDTAFHHDLPGVAQTLAIPRAYRQKGVRRYGFHGLSYESLMGELARLEGRSTAGGRVILAHLGGGASLAAVRDGKPVDTSMGFTPASGLPMGTRCGDLDPGLVRYLLQTERFDAERFDRFVNFECGLLGVSGSSGDMRELLARERTDARAAEAIELFCYQAKKWIGSFAAALGGLDTLVFSGGIGEHCPSVRARICAGLEFLGIGIDEAGNAAGEPVISQAGRPVVVRVIPTDEERVIARSACRVLRLDS